MASLRFIPNTGSHTGTTTTLTFLDDNPEESLERQRRAINDKWSELGFLDGLTGHVRPEITQLYESQASHLLNETNTSTYNRFEDVTFPIVRRVYSTINNPVKKKDLIIYKMKKLEL